MNRFLSIKGSRCNGTTSRPTFAASIFEQSLERRSVPMTDTLYAPPDIAQAYCDWRCNCGPAAFAAVIRKPAMCVQRFFPMFPNRPWTNEGKMAMALNMVPINHRRIRGLPKYGLVLLQIVGPWCRPEVNVKAKYTKTHWCGISGDMVYDVNADGWISKAEWGETIRPAILEANKRSTGFTIIRGFEVSL